MTIARFLFFCPFFAVGFAFISYGRYSLKMANAVKRWPVVQGVLNECRLVEDKEFDGPYNFYNVEVLYSYSVEDITYQASRIAFGYAATKNREVHQKIYDNLKKSNVVKIYHDPREPGISALSADADRTWFLFGAIWTAAITIMFLIVLFGG